MNFKICNYEIAMEFLAESSTHVKKTEYNINLSQQIFENIKVLGCEEKVETKKNELILVRKKKHCEKHFLSLTLKQSEKDLFVSGMGCLDTILCMPLSYNEVLNWVCSLRQTYDFVFSSQLPQKCEAFSCCVIGNDVPFW